MVLGQKFTITSVEFTQCTQLTVIARVNPTEVAGSSFSFNWVANKGSERFNLYSLTWTTNGQISMEKTQNSFLSAENYDVTNEPIENSPISPYDSSLTVRKLPKNRSIVIGITSGSIIEDSETVITPSCTFPRDIYCDSNCLTSTPCSTSFTKECLNEDVVLQNCPADVNDAENNMCPEVAFVCALSGMEDDHLSPVDKGLESVGLGDVLPFECMEGYTGNTAEYNCSARNVFTPMGRSATCSPLSSRNLIAGLVIGIIAVLMLSGVGTVCSILGVERAIKIVSNFFRSTTKKKEIDVNEEPAKNNI